MGLTSVVFSILAWLKKFNGLVYSAEESIESIDAAFNTTVTKECTKLKELCTYVCRTRWVEKHDAFAFL